MRSTPLLPALFAGALLASAPARAEDAAEREGRALFAKANQRIQSGDYAGALALFQSAYARYPNVKILLNIGTMLRELGRNAEAVDAYETYIRDPGADSAKKAEVEKLLKALDLRVAKLRVEVDDPRTTVVVDGKTASMREPNGAITMRLEPGPHTVVASGGDRPPQTRNVDAIAGKELMVSFRAARAEPPAPPPDTGPSGKRVGGFVTLSIGAAGLLAGGATGIIAILDHNAAASGCPSHHGCSQDVLDHASRGKTLSTVSTALLSVGAAAAGVGLYLVITSGKPAASAPAVGVAAAPGGGQFAVRGGF